jgi:hypothetical protein
MKKLALLLFAALLLFSVSTSVWLRPHGTGTAQSLPPSGTLLKCSKQGFDCYLGAVLTNGTSFSTSNSTAIVLHDPKDK